MFSILTFLLILIGTLPITGMPAVSHANSQDKSVVPNVQTKISPIPTGSVGAHNQVNNNSSKPETPPGQAVSAIATAPHDGGISEAVHEITPGNKVYPTPIISPVPMITDIPPITPPVFNPKPTVEPGGCPPCNGNGKFACIDVMCPL